MAKLIYEGSVKNVFELDLTRYEFQFTDSYSVFDWGKMPDEIPGKGEALTSITTDFFEMLGDPKSWEVFKKEDLSLFWRPFAEPLLIKLQKNGLAHHFVKKTASNRILVNAVSVDPPKLGVVLNEPVYFYLDPELKKLPARLIPLEFVFRFGAPEGSSFLNRSQNDSKRIFGFDQEPKPNEWFKNPVVECFSKLEDQDRFLTFEQALNYSCIEPTEMTTVLTLTYLVGLFLKKFYQKRGILLWDGKLEWALLDGEITLVDSIGPDEMRLTDQNGFSLSKEFLREIYRKTNWYKKMRTVKASFEEDWRTQVGAPPALSPEELKVVKSMYQWLMNCMDESNLEKTKADLEILLSEMRICQSH